MASRCEMRRDSFPPLERFHKTISRDSTKILKRRHIQASFGLALRDLQARLYFWVYIQEIESCLRSPIFPEVNEKATRDEWPQSFVTKVKELVCLRFSLFKRTNTVVGFFHLHKLPLHERLHIRRKVNSFLVGSYRSVFATLTFRDDVGSALKVARSPILTALFSEDAASE